MDQNEARVTITLKADLSAPWVVIRANDGEEAHALLQQVYSGTQSLAEHAAAATATLSLVWRDERNKHVGESQAAQAVAQAVGGTVVQQQAQPAAGSLQAPPTCIHGEMVARSGSKNGRNWSGWFCPTPKDTPGQCAPQFNKG